MGGRPVLVLAGSQSAQQRRHYRCSGDRGRRDTRLPLDDRVPISPYASVIALLLSCGQREMREASFHALNLRPITPRDLMESNPHTKGTTMSQQTVLTNQRAETKRRLGRASAC